MKKLLAFTLPFGLLLEVCYLITKRFITEIPDSIAYPTMIISCLLMIVGLAYNGHCFGKKRNPYKFK